jgi:hypothetical protein
VHNIEAVKPLQRLSNTESNRGFLSCSEFSIVFVDRVMQTAIREEISDQRKRSDGCVTEESDDEWGLGLNEERCLAIEKLFVARIEIFLRKLANEDWGFRRRSQ